MAAEHESDNQRLVRRAVDRRPLLSRTEQLFVRPVRTADNFDQSSWFAALPDHQAIGSSDRTAQLESDTSLLTIDRLAKLDPPIIPDAPAERVDGKLDNPGIEPSVRKAIYREEPLPASGTPAPSKYLCHAR